MPASGPGYLDMRAGIEPAPKTRTGRKRAAKARERRRERCAVYGRLSLRTDETTSPERQVEICEELPRLKAGTYDPDADLYEDMESFSGYQLDTRRPAYEALLAAIIEGRYDVVVVYRLDRITRRVAELAKLLDILEKYNVALVSATEPIDTSSEYGKMIVYIVGVIAEMESNNTGDRVASAQEFMTRNGRFRGGSVPFGFRAAETKTEGGHYYRQEPFEVDIIREAIDDALTHGNVLRITRSWNEAGLESNVSRVARERWEQRRRDAHEKGETFDQEMPEPKPWTPGGVRCILSNPVLVGWGVFGEDLVRDDGGEPIEIAPPIIDYPTFELLRARITYRGRGGQGVTAADSMLGEIVECDECGRHLGSHGQSYNCHSYRASVQRPGAAGPDDEDGKPCPGVSIRKDKLDSFVLGWLAEHLTDETLAAAHAAIMALRPPEVDEVDENAAKRAELRARLRRLREDREAGLYDGDEDKKEYEGKVRDLNQRLAALRHVPTPRDELELLLARPITLDELLNRDVAEFRRFLSAMVQVRVPKGVRGDRRPVGERVQIGLSPALEALVRAPRSGQRSVGSRGRRPGRSRS